MRTRLQPLSAGSQKVRELARRPDGITQSEAWALVHAVRKTAVKRLSSLCDRGHLYRVLDEGEWRYFINREASRAWLGIETTPTPVEYVGFATLGIGRYLER